MCGEHGQEKGSPALGGRNQRQDGCCKQEKCWARAEKHNEFCSVGCFVTALQKNWAYRSYAVGLRRVSIIQTANFVLSLDILPRNYGYLWSQEHATLYLLYSCTQVRHARQRSDCFWNICKAERGKGRELKWRLDKDEFSNTAVSPGRSKDPQSQCFALGSGQIRCWRKKNQSSMLWYLPIPVHTPSLLSEAGLNVLGLKGKPEALKGVCERGKY